MLLFLLANCHFRHAARYNATSGEFTNFASIQPCDSYGIFMYELYQRKELNSRDHYEAYRAFENWSWLRNIVQSSRWTSWISDWVPRLRPKKDFRFIFNTNLDIQIGGPEKRSSWVDWARVALLWQSGLSDQTHKDQSHPPGRLLLNSTNFVGVLASALEVLKAEFLKEHNITITSAVIAKPQWIYNDLDNLIDQACLKANLEVLDKMSRSEAAMKIATKAGKSEPLVLEQSGYDFRLQRPSSSMGRDDLSAAWIPARLASEMLESLGFIVNGTIETLNAASMRLVVEVAKTRTMLRYAYMKEPDLFDEQESMIIVPDFGATGFTFMKPLPGENISRVEEEFVQAIQEAVETMLLNYDEVHEYQKDQSFLSSTDIDEADTLQAAFSDLAKTIPHPLAASGRSWWHSIDALLVLADFPDANLIMRGAMRAIRLIPGLDCGSISDKSFLEYDLAARGAALEASKYVEHWEEEERWKKCESESCEFEEEGSLMTEHEEL